MNLTAFDKIKLFREIKKSNDYDFNYSFLINIFGRGKYREQAYLHALIEKIDTCLEEYNINDKLFIKYLILLKSCLIRIKENKIELNYFYISKIDKFLNRYKNYILNYDLEENESIINLFNATVEIINSFDVEHIIDYDEFINEEMDLSEKVSKLLLLNQKYLKKIETKQKKIESMNADNIEKTKKISMLENEIKTKTKEQEKLKNTISELEVKHIHDINALELEHETQVNDDKKRIEQLERGYEKVSSDYITLKEKSDEYKRKYEFASSELEELSRSKSDLEVKYKESVLDKEKLILSISEEEKLKIKYEHKLKQIEEIILDCLCSHEYVSLEYIIYKVELAKISTSISEIRQVFTNLKNRTNIVDSGIKNGTPLYKLSAPSIETNVDFNICLKKDFIDILFVADFHIESLKESFKEDYSKILEYSVNNDIDLIINLGDFFDFGRHGYHYTYNEFQRIEEVVYGLIDWLPKEEGISHAVIGGNHDESNGYLGIDCLKKFIDARDDFLHLGYREATVNFIKGNSLLTSIMLSHPHTELDRRHLKTKISKMCSINNRAVSDYSSFYLGHSHESYLDIDSRVCVVPSYSMDKYRKGAWHVRMYFDTKTLEEQHFKPLILDRKLSPISEFVFRK